MKSNFGKPLNTDEMKFVLGGNEIPGDEGFASCTFMCYCTSTWHIRAKCSTGSCSGEDGVGGSCNGTYYSCTSLCNQ